MKLVPVGGTHHGSEPWVVDDLDPLWTALQRRGLTPARYPDGHPWTWDGRLSGLPFQGIGGWVKSSYGLEAFSSLLPYEERNYLAHSHGGNLVLLMCARGFKIRSLTTVGTPRRHDVPAEEAVRYIGYWQHIFDERWDLMGTLRRRLGAIGDGNASLDRQFRIPGVVNRPTPGISHSRVLRDPRTFHLWEDQGWADAILHGNLRAV